ncbi:hypothetical protein, partial [Luedemannella flava]|uniref:hypothetical protein n=1 Tax=Luedemannella flava TaxID=349316 RepID=UPI0031D433E6
MTTRLRGGPLTTAASALAFGVLGWLCGHEVVLRLLAHSHGADHGVAAGVEHVHDSRAATVIIAAFVGVTALVAALSPVIRRGLSGHQAWALHAPLSTVGFLAVELARSGVAGEHILPPPLVLLVGCLVQALIGTGGALLWRAGAAALRRCVACLRAVPDASLRLRPAPPVGPA